MANESLSAAKAAKNDEFYTQYSILWQASGNTRASAPEDILRELKYRPHPQDRGGCTIVNGNRTYGRILIKKLNHT